MPKRPALTSSGLSFQDACLAVLALTALTGLLAYMRPVLVPFVVALFLYFSLLPVLALARERLGLRPFFALLLTGMLGVGLLSGVAALAAASVRDFASQFDAYKASFLSGAGRALHWAEARGLVTGGADLRQALEDLPLFKWAGTLTGSAVGLLSTAALAAVFLFFLLGSQQGGAKRHSLQWHAGEAISRYLQVKLLASLATGLVTWLALSLLGVDLAVLFGILAFFLNFIPNLGGLLTILLPLPVVLAQYGLGGRLLAVLAATALPQAFIGNFIETKYLGESLGLHPVAVLLALLFWGMIWGLPGMFLAVPLTSVLKIALDQQERTRPLARLLAGDLE